MNQHYDIARDLLSIKAVQIKTDSYFTWTSGIKSPIYCDNRLTMSYPKVRNRIIDGFINKIKTFKKQPDVIAGCATAGIPHAAWIAERLNLPMVYVRSSPKGHGKGNQIEGLVKKGQKILVVEDLISTGGSSLDVVNVLKEEGAEIIGVIAIFTYGLNKTIRRFEKEGVPLITLTGFDYLVEALVEDEEITKTDQETLLSWRNNL
ncbi:MAG TPA: orotate phosphoribosyltransferase [Pseudogracilibacillus sp.]|nr:orotate phosphoribosyltransferase [Pseudogracilibacillus sp.]